MVSVLTVYPNKTTASSTLSTANQLIANATINANGSALTNLVGNATGFGEITSQGTASAWAAGVLNTSIAPTGKGWFLDSSILDAQTIAGSWQAIWRGLLNLNTATIDLYTRIYSYLSGVYTQLGVISQMTTAWTSALATYTSTSQALSSAAFPTGSHLYVDLWGFIQATTMTGANTIAIRQSNIAGDGESVCNIITPGFSPTPVVTATGGVSGGHHRGGRNGRQHRGY